MVSVERISEPEDDEEEIAVEGETTAVEGETPAPDADGGETPEA